MTTTRIFRTAALLFALIIAGIIIAADAGQVNRLFGFLYSFPYGDTAGHFMLMGILSFFVVLGFTSRRAALGPVRPLISCLVLAGLVTLEECSQLFLPNRTFSLIDLSANYAGILIMGEIGARVKMARKRSGARAIGC